MVTVILLFVLVLLLGAGYMIARNGTQRRREGQAQLPDQPESRAPSTTSVADRASGVN